MTRRTRDRIRHTGREALSYCAGIILAILLFIIPGGIAGTLEARYSDTAIIRSINGGEILVEDSRGNLWTYTLHDYKVGDKVVVTWDTQHTDDEIEDDKITKIKKIKR